MGDKSAPEMEGKGRVNTGETGYKMCFEGVDSFLSRVCAVVVWRGELVVDVVKFEEGLETCWTFVVYDLKNGHKDAI